MNPFRPVYVVAIDLGASFGRVMVGTIHDGRVALTQTRRFANGPVPLPTRAGERLYWDVLRLWSEIREGLLAAVRDVGPLSAIGNAEEVKSLVEMLVSNIRQDEIHRKEVKNLLYKGKRSGFTFGSLQSAKKGATFTRLRPRAGTDSRPFLACLGVVGMNYGFLPSDDLLRGGKG